MFSFCRIFISTGTPITISGKTFTKQFSRLSKDFDPNMNEITRYGESINICGYLDNFMNIMMMMAVLMMTMMKLMVMIMITMLMHVKDNDSNNDDDDNGYNDYDDNDG